MALMATSALANDETQYPQQIRAGFLDKCVGLNQELVEPCKCILQGLQRHIPYETFETEILKMPDPMQDRRVLAIAQQCAFKASAKQQQ